MVHPCEFVLYEQHATGNVCFCNCVSILGHPSESMMYQICMPLLEVFVFVSVFVSEFLDLGLSHVVADQYATAGNANQVCCD